MEATVTTHEAKIREEMEVQLSDFEDRCAALFALASLTLEVAGDTGGVALPMTPEVAAHVLMLRDDLEELREANEERKAAAAAG
jgi:hypothetical protein